MFTVALRFTQILAIGLLAQTVCAQTLATATPEQVGFSAERLAKITQVFKQEVEQGKLPGAVMMIARKNRLVYSEAIGFQNKEAATAMSAFNWAWAGTCRTLSVKW